MIIIHDNNTFAIFILPILSKNPFYNVELRKGVKGCCYRKLKLNKVWFFWHWFSSMGFFGGNRPDLS